MPNAVGRLARILLSCALVTCAACALLVGLGDSYDPAADGGADSGEAGPDAGGDSGPSACPVCAPGVPGWDGPLAFFPADDASTRVPCSVPWGQPRAQVFGTTAMLTSCACACSPASSTCDLSISSTPSTGTCSGEFDNATPGKCVNFQSPASTAEVDVKLTRGACAPIDPPQPPFPTIGSLCGPSSLLVACPSGACLPTAPRYCITAAGDLPCPPGPFTVRTSASSSFVDNRSCACACSQPDGGKCGAATATFSTNVNCNGTAYALSSDLGCTYLINMLSSGASSALVDAAPDVTPAACVATAQPDGAAQPSGPLTMCCLP